MSYVDGFVAAVPAANRELYKKSAQAAAVVFKEHGALQVVECWGDDVPEGKLTSFPMAVKRKEDEAVVFSWITWPSRTWRDGQAIHEKTTVSSCLRFTARGKDVSLPSGTSSPQHSTTFNAPCSLKTTAAAWACFL